MITEETTAPEILTVPFRAQWYTKQGDPVLTVPSAKDGTPRRPTLRDARAMALIPDTSLVLRVLSNPVGRDAKAEHMTRLALQRSATAPEAIDAALDEVAEEVEYAGNASLRFAATFRAEALFLAAQIPRQADLQPDVSAWLETFRNAWLARIQSVYWADIAIVSRLGFCARPDMLVFHPRWGLTLVDIRTQGTYTKDGLPRLHPQWSWKLGACALVFGPGAAYCTLVANPDKPGSLSEIWWPPAKIEEGSAVFKSALLLWRSLTGYDPRKVKKGGAM